MGCLRQALRRALSVRKYDSCGIDFTTKQYVSLFLPFFSLARPRQPLVRPGSYVGGRGGHARGTPDV